MESEYDLKLCTSASELLEAYRLRIEVFHEEQKFLKETEIDRYDPVSAHFLLLSNKDGAVVATVRLTPFPHPKLANNEDESTKTVQEMCDAPLGTARSECFIVNEFMQAFKLQSQHGVKLSRLAVRKVSRSNGLGALSVKIAERWLLKVLTASVVRNGNFSDGNFIPQDLNISVSSQIQVKDFYKKLSYVTQGQPYDEEGMLHILCTKRIICENGK